MVTVIVPTYFIGLLYCILKELRDDAYYSENYLLAYYYLIKDNKFLKSNHNLCLIESSVFVTEHDNCTCSIDV